MITSAGTIWAYSPSGYPIEVSTKRGSAYGKYRNQGTAGRIVTRSREDNVYTFATLAELLDNGNVGSTRGVDNSDAYRSQPNSLYGNWQDNWRNTLP